jgi:hypothetical protein
MQLRWCAAKLPAEYQTSDKVAYAKSYKLMVLSDEKEKNALKCHPLLSSTGKCKAEDVIVDPQLPDNSVVKYPEQSRQHFALFTRDRLYDWSVQTCFDDIAYKCGGGSQSWKFTTKIELIGVPGAVSPKNDPNGIEPVGLPLAITWTIPDGANSFVYQASFLPGSKKVDWPTVPNEKMNANEKKLFDADNLKPDTEYKWRVKACAYFNSSDCDSWSEWFVFRTTGRPPKPETMKVEGNVPAIFSWEAVPGAKSYNFSLFKSSGETKTALLNDIEFL